MEQSVLYKETLTPAEQAARMAEWLPDFVNNITNKIGYLPDLTAKRIDGLFGNEVDQAEALRGMLSILPEFSDSHDDMEIYGLFVCGYPTEELEASCDDLNAAMERIHERLAPVIAAHEAKRIKPISTDALAARRLGSHATTGVFYEPKGELAWQDGAPCSQTDPEVFFPEKGGTTREGKQVCLGCDVRDKCLSYALDNDERFGIWGGLSERERRRLKKGIT